MAGGGDAAGGAYWAESSGAGGEHVRGGGGPYWAESSGAGGEHVQGGGAPAWPRIPDSRIFSEEFRRGEPEMRPDFGSIVLARTAGMVEQEKQFRGYALWATEETWGVRVTAAALLSAMELQCGVNPSAVKLEVTSPPYHFFLRFDSEDECARVVVQSLHLTCCGTRMVFVRWNWRGRGVPGKKPFKCTLSFDGLPEEVQEPQAMNLLVAGVDGEIIEMLPATDRWVTPVRAWLRDPCSVPKQLNVKIPAPPLPPATWSEENGESPPPPWSPTSKQDQNIPVIVHMKTVIDRDFLLDAGLDCYSESPGRDLTRMHYFSTWRGKIDGTGPGDNGTA